MKVVSKTNFYYVLPICSQILLRIQINHCYRENLACCLSSQQKYEDSSNHICFLDFQVLRQI